MPERLRAVFAASLAVIGGCLSGCSINNPTVDTFLYLVPSRAQFAAVQQGFEYLIVELDGRASVLALGRRDPPVAGAAAREHWYNSQGEMLALKGGRIDRAVGMAHEWRHQESRAPSWESLDKAVAPIAWTRKVDRMPGYRFGDQDQITSGRVQGPTATVDGVPPSAQWYWDHVVSRTPEGKPWRFEQRFAVVDERVVYSEQCLAPAVCFKLKPLGVVK